VLPDVIVLDLMMPGLNGYDFRKAMMGVRGAAAIPVIVMTAAPQVAMRALLSPFAVLHKPFGLDDLTAAVRDAARLRR
jgi:DNA-binding response OmpR family regulator